MKFKFSVLKSGLKRAFSKYEECNFSELEACWLHCASHSPMLYILEHYINTVPKATLKELSPQADKFIPKKVFLRKVGMVLLY